MRITLCAVENIVAIMIGVIICLTSSIGAICFPVILICVFQSATMPILGMKDVLQERTMSIPFDLAVVINGAVGILYLFCSLIFDRAGNEKRIMWLLTSIAFLLVSICFRLATI